VSSTNTAVLRWVKTGKTFGDEVEILSGLDAKEPYIISAKENCITELKLCK
jgi:hypothetical protein